MTFCIDIFTGKTVEKIKLETFQVIKTLRTKKWKSYEVP